MGTKQRKLGWNCAAYPSHLLFVSYPLTHLLVMGALQLLLGCLPMMRRGKHTRCQHSSVRVTLPSRLTVGLCVCEQQVRPCCFHDSALLLWHIQVSEYRMPL